YYDVTDGGNFEGHTILYNSMNLSSIAFHFGKSESEIRQILKQSREKLYAVRAKRVRPGRDDKIMTSWNSLMVTAFVKGYRVTGEQDFVDAARNAIYFIESKLTKDGELLHTYKDGQSKLKAYLDDYAYFVNALLDYFEVAPSKKYLDLAVYYANYLIEHFWDETQKNFFFTADNHEKLIIRTKNIYDLSLPSGNSVAAGVMLRLYHLTHEKKYLDVSLKVMESLAIMAAENPFGFGQLLNTIYSYLQKPVEITLVNTINDNVKNYLLKKFIPEAILVMISKKEDLENLKELQFFAGKEFDDTKTKVYVCRDFTCSLPLGDISEIEKLV
ncbi:MAG: thioredoxin domain-containing protein, partial [Nitrosotalea sp.]